MRFRGGKRVMKTVARDRFEGRERAEALGAVLRRMSIHVGAWKDDLCVESAVKNICISVILRPG